MWFKHKNDEGIVHADFVDDNGIRLVSMSLILATVSFIIFSFNFMVLTDVAG